MFGFGDDQVPFTESVDLLEDLVVEYITEMVRKQDFAHIYSPIVIKEITNSMQLSLLILIPFTTKGSPFDGVKSSGIGQSKIY